LAFCFEGGGHPFQLATRAGQEAGYGCEVVGSSGHFDRPAQCFEAMGAKIGTRAPDGVREAGDGRSIGGGERLVQVSDDLRRALEEQFDEVAQ
jgi:hypothetical protein